MEYAKICGILETGTRADLESVAVAVVEFPDGKDDFVQRHWIINAIDVGSALSVSWMIGKGVNLHFVDDKGCSVLHACFERKSVDRYQLLEMLIEAGADLNAQAFLDRTPLHMAAMRDDVRALELLLRAGADRSRRTRIDDCATPEEQARLRGREMSANFIRDFE